MAARCQQCRVMGRGVLVLQHEFETVVGTFSGHVHFLGGKCKCPSCRRQHRASPLFSLSLLYHARLPPLLPSPSTSLSHLPLFEVRPCHATKLASAWCLPRDVRSGRRVAQSSIQVSRSLPFFPCSPNGCLRSEDVGGGEQRDARVR